MTKATREIASGDKWEAKVKDLQQTYWSNNLVWLQRHLIRQRDNLRSRTTLEDAPQIESFDWVCEWVELGSATYLTMRDVLWAESQLD